MATKRYTTALSKTPKMQVANTKNGTFVRSNFHLFDPGLGAASPWKGIAFNCCRYSLMFHDCDFVGPIPALAYMKIMDRTWIWISTQQVVNLSVDPILTGVPGDNDPFSDSEIPTSPDTTDIDRSNTLNQESDTDADNSGGEDDIGADILRKALNKRIGIQYNRVQSETEKATKRRRELRNKDPLNGGPDSSDDSVDGNISKRIRTNSGVRPRKSKNKRNEIYRLAVGGSKRLYPCSDSEQEAEGYDNSRVPKRARVSGSKKNFTIYIQRGPAKAHQSRDLIRPADTLLNTLMVDRQHMTYQAPFYIDRTVGLIVDIDNQKETFDQNIFTQRFEDILASVSLKYPGRKFIMEYTTVNNLGPFRLDDSASYDKLRALLLALPASERAGMFTVTSSSKNRRTGKTVAFSLPGVTRIRFRNRVTMTQACPVMHTEAFPWNESPISDISNFVNLDAFLRALLKGNDWEQWYPDLVRPTYTVIQTAAADDEPESDMIFYPLNEREFKKLKDLVELAPKQTISIEIVKDYEANPVRPPITHFYVAS